VSSMPPENNTNPENSSPRRGEPRLSQTMERVFQSLSLGLAVYDPQLKITHFNPAAEFLVGGHDSIAEAQTAVIHDSQYQNWQEEFREVIERGGERRFEHVLYRHPQHGELLLNLLGIPLSDPMTHEISGGILVIEDVTSAVSMEKRLAVSERMAAVGKLAARVAHELNNPLDGILRYLNLAIRAHEMGVTDKIGNYMQEARGGLMRMTEIVKELVEFSRSAYTAFDDAGINSVVEEAIKVMSDKALQNDVSIVCTLKENLPAIRGTNLFQVFCNLVKNAVDAMPDGGTLTVITGITDHEAIVTFEDTGIGLPDDIDRIFEPFYTTKAPGRGTGLGLPISRDIVEKYNGKITAQRGAKEGSIFTVRIPLQSCTTAKGGATKIFKGQSTSPAKEKPQ